ncbi:hypothetical protein KAT08_02525 [Candidatus Babeliales bacterium]|nr:hypothetical protein [Candidatus Babeliales bacterium]
MIKNIRNVFFKTFTWIFLAISAFSFTNTYSQVQVHRLQSLSQQSADCGFYATWGASCMAQNNSLNEARKILLDRNLFNQKLINWKKNIKKYNGTKTNINGNEMHKFVLPTLNNKEHITIIDSPKHFNAIKSNVAVPCELIKGIEEFRKNGIPHAIIYNQGGHWVGYGIRKENRQTIIFKTNSCGTSENKYVAKNGTIEDMLYKWFTGQEKLIPGEIIQEIDRIANTINFNQDILSAKNYIYNLFNKVILLGLQNTKSYCNILINNFDIIKNFGPDAIKESFEIYILNISKNIERFKNYASLQLYSNYKNVNITNENAPYILKKIADQFNKQFSLQILTSTNNEKNINPFCNEYAYQILNNIIQQNIKPKRINPIIIKENKIEKEKLFVQPVTPKTQVKKTTPKKQVKKTIQPTTPKQAIDPSVIKQVKQTIKEKINEFNSSKDPKKAEQLMFEITDLIIEFRLWKQYAKMIRDMPNKLEKSKTKEKENKTKKLKYNDESNTQIKQAIKRRILSLKELMSNIWKLSQKEKQSLNEYGIKIELNEIIELIESAQLTKLEKENFQKDINLIITALE